MSFSISKKSLRAFALLEIFVVLLALAGVSAVTAALFQQIAKATRKASISGTIVEVRGRINSISKNPDPWLNKLRGTYSVFSSCIPHAKAVSGQVYNCPTPLDKNALKQMDPQIAEIAGTQLHVYSHEIKDAMGDSLAGSAENPSYLDPNGKVCAGANAATTCPIKSIGYFLRSNASNSSNPGEVRFVVKLEPNMAAMSQQGSGTFKPEILSIDLGQSWMDSSSPITKNSPLYGALLMGYKPDGEPYYTKPGVKCFTGEFLTGLDDEGKALCKKIPEDCASQKYAISGSSSELSCSTNTECDASQVHVGYYAGSGLPMCQSLETKCADNEILTGAKSCVKLPSCDESQKITFNGTAFSCMQEVAAQKCPAGFIMVGINADKTVRCEEQDRSLASDKLTCPDGQVVYGVEKDGSVKCRPEINYKGKSCDLKTEAMVGFDANGDLICSKVTKPPRVCKCCYAFNGDSSREIAGACGHGCYFTNACMVRRFDTAYSYSDNVGIEGGECGFATDRGQSYVPGKFTRDCK